MSDAGGAALAWRVGLVVALVGLAAIGVRGSEQAVAPEPTHPRPPREPVAEPEPVDAPPPPTGEVSVQVNGPGRVWIDGRAMGSVRWERRYALPIGAHRVKVVGSGATVEQVVTVERAGEVVVEVVGRR